MAQNLSAVFSITDKYTVAIRKIMKSQDTFERKQTRLDKLTKAYNNRMRSMKSAALDGANGIGSLTTRLTGLISAAYLTKKAFDLTFQSINTSAFQKVQETTFQALLNSREAGSNLYKYVGAYAKTSALGREDIAKGVTTFLTATRDISQVEQLIKMTERLYAKDPTQGAEGAVFALKEALSGDVISPRNRYGITGLSGESLRNADINGKIAQIDVALNAFGATQEVVDANYAGLITQTNIFTSNLKTDIGESAAPIMNNLANVVARLNENMDAGKYQPFISLMVNGMNLIGTGIAFVVDNANWLIPVIGGVVTGLVAYKAATMAATMWTTLASVAVNGLTGNWAAAVGIIAAVTAGAWGLSKAFSSIDASTAGGNLEDLKSAAGKTLAGAKLPVEITNTDPVKVTGQVDIEQESMKYMLDIAGAKWFAQYSTATLAPQVTVQNMNVAKEVDADGLLDHVADGLATSIEAAPKGAYAT